MEMVRALSDSFHVVWIASEPTLGIENGNRTTNPGYRECAAIPFTFIG